MANPRTIARIEGAIKRRIAHCLQFEVADPRAGFVTIIDAQLTPDLAKVTVRWSVLDPKTEKGRVMHMLDHARGFVQRKMGRVLTMRRMPHLEWKYDDSSAEAARLDQVIRHALDRDAAVRGSAWPPEEPDSPEPNLNDPSSHSPPAESEQE